jgi:L,D-transpeptidase catalytic domain
MKMKAHKGKDIRKTSGFVFAKSVLFVLFVFLCIGSDGFQHISYSKKPFQAISAGTTFHIDFDDGLWDGPILFHKGNGQPVHLILVKKAFQKLYLYCYDGHYQLIKSYNCSTGEHRGKKQKEHDQKTPEGIYFNISVYRDSKVTLFGDRAFGLNYPDIFDRLEGNSGSGIFIHGSDQTLKPYSTNGCVVLNNRDLADLDQQVPLERTPVIIGENLPYRFEPAGKEPSELMMSLQQAMLPERYQPLNRKFRSITVFGFKKRIVAVSEVNIEDRKRTHGFSRIYLYRPNKNLLVLLKREWSEE